MSTPGSRPSVRGLSALTTMRVASTLLDDAVAPRDDGDAGVARDDALHAGADERRLGAQQRHRLALHVRAHERAVRVVVLEERDQRRRRRDTSWFGDTSMNSTCSGGTMHELAAVARRDAGRP